MNETLSAAYVLEVGLGRDFILAVVQPLVGIAYLHTVAVELVNGSGFGLIAHPIDVLDAFPQCQAQVADKVNHAFLGFGREVPFHIELADGFAQIVRSLVKHTTPAGVLLFYVIEVFFIEVEVFGDEVIAKSRGTLCDDHPSHVVLDGAEVGVEEEAIEGGEEVGRGHVEAVEGRCSDGMEVVVPAEVGHGGLKFLATFQVIEVVGVEAFLDGHGTFGKFGLKIKDMLSFFRC